MTRLLDMILFAVAAKGSPPSSDGDSCFSSPNCASRNRQECSPPRSSCGPCLGSFVSSGRSEHSNEPCVASIHSTTCEGMGNIPVVNIQRLRNGSEEDQAEVIRSVRAAVEGPGFMYVNDTSIDPARLFDEMRSFFARPLEEKVRSEWRLQDNSGYVRVGGEGLDEDASGGDLKESYDMNLEHLTSSDVWSKGVAQAFWESANRLKEDILEGYSLSLGLSRSFFQPLHSEEWNTLRLLHYLPITGEGDAQAKCRVGPHSDYGTMTLLFQDQVGGLQVLDRKCGQWVAVPAIENTVLVNTADLMMRWTNDRFPSTLHRVVGPGVSGSSEEDVAASKLDRYSIAFFVNPNKDQVVAQLPNDDSDARYPPIRTENYLLQRLSSTYTEILGDDPEVAASAVLKAASHEL